MLRATDLIPVKWFYVLPRDKTKINWLAYEYACSLYEDIKGSAKLDKWKAGKTDAQIAEFCAYFAKRMKRSLIDLHAGVEDSIIADEDYVADLCHTQTHKQNIAILEVAAETWDELMKICKACPSNCTADCDSYSEFFDRMESGNFY